MFPCFQVSNSQFTIAQETLSCKADTQGFID